ncbi:OmpA family protein [Paracoccus sp. (in: a-proteobacteria)]|uniref:OmpA family protein n=1 Tax=Paracoccus sp. TaxID=267 RepID=UPI0032201E94
MANSLPPGRRPARRRTRAAASLIALAAAAGLSFLGARMAADFIEARSRADLTQALAGIDWLSFSTDGLQVRLEGIAPDEVQRFRARARAESVVDPGRVLDAMQVAASARLATPDFAIELLRNEDGISFIGLAPASLDRKALLAQIRRQTGATQVADLMESADYPVPEGWDAALALGLKAAALAPRAKVSVAPGRVAVRAIADSPRQKAEFELLLERARPDGVTLEAEITAPRPVIAPFALRLVKDAQGTRLDPCAADSEAARARILAAAQQAGLTQEAQCPLGLGAPNARWADAAVAAIAALGALDAGSVTISDGDVALLAPPSVAAARVDAAAASLKAALPEGFTLTADHETGDAAVAPPPAFSATLTPRGVTLDGRIASERMRAAVESLARSRLGAVQSRLQVDGDLPEGWTLRAIAALEALDGLARGSVAVTPDLIRLRGVSGSRGASDLAVARLSERLGAGARYALEIGYDRRLDPLLQLPSGIDCVDRLNAAMAESEIGFEPGKAVIAGDPAPTLARLGEIMRQCGDYRIEIGGHTDSRGSEAVNAELSRLRAQAIHDAMAGAGIATRHLTARGYGASRPMAENDSDEGREANRRIEFTLLGEEPLAEAEPAPAPSLEGVTADPEAVAQRRQAAARAAATGAVAPVLAPGVAAGLPGAILPELRPLPPPAAAAD